jgi:hypothetical protein
MILKDTKIIEWDYDILFLGFDQSGETITIGEGSDVFSCEKIDCHSMNGDLLLFGGSEGTILLDVKSKEYREIDFGFQAEALALSRDSKSAIGLSRVYGCGEESGEMYFKLCEIGLGKSKRKNEWFCGYKDISEDCDQKSRRLSYGASKISGIGYTEQGRPWITTTSSLMITFCKKFRKLYDEDRFIPCGNGDTCVYSMIGGRTGKHFSFFKNNRKNLYCHDRSSWYATSNVWDKSGLPCEMVFSNCVGNLGFSGAIEIDPFGFLIYGETLEFFSSSNKKCSVVTNMDSKEIDSFIPSNILGFRNIDCIAYCEKKRILACSSGKTMTVSKVIF